MRPLTILLVACRFACAFTPTVTKIDPPNWWIHHTLNPVRVLVNGTGLAGATLEAPAGISAGNIRVNASGTYLLADLDISKDAKPGSYPLQFKTQGGQASVPFELAEPLASSGRFAGFGPDDVIYLIMPDRFANGDPTNDDPPSARGLFNRSKSRFYHGGDLQGIIDHLSYFKELGVTALWITPVYDNVNHLNQTQAVDGEGIADYHGYGAVDYYAVDEHLGTLALLKELVDRAHAVGLKVIQDQVANHVGPDHPWVKDPPKPTWFHGTAASHTNETWQIWSLPDPHASDKVKRDVTEGWFVNLLPDMNQEDPDVAQYEIQNALWWLGVAGFDGIRQDTLPYVGRAFWRDWSAALKRQYPDARAVGEVFDFDPAVPSFFQGGAPRADDIDSGIDSVFDFPNYFNIHEVFAKNGEMEKLSRILAQDRLYPDPSRLVTFLGNHDTPRFLYENGATIAGLKLAFTFLLTLRGIPSIYYGDEIAMQGGPDPDNRRDFPGGWKGDLHNAFEASGRTETQNDVYNHVRNLLRVRAGSEALRRGTMTELALTAQTWAYARQIPGDTAIVVINNGVEPADVKVPFTADGKYGGKLGVVPALTIQNGLGIVHLASHSAEVFEARAQ